MQEQMTVCLNELASQVTSKMAAVHDELDARPRIKGDDPIPSLSSFGVNRDDSGAMLVSSAMGIPGMSETMNAAMDIGAELYGSRKATRARPQDEKPLSIKEMCAIRSKNKQDLMTLHDLERKKLMIDSCLSTGHTRAAIVNGELLPLIDPKGPSLDKKDEDQHPNNNFVFAKRMNMGGPMLGA
jgi:hypothetical protein